MSKSSLRHSPRNALPPDRIPSDAFDDAEDAKTVIVRRLALDRIRTGTLLPIRREDDPAELSRLARSISAIGLFDPVHVVPNEADGGYDLISGHRRLAAFRQLHARDPEGGYDRIPAVLAPAGETKSVFFRQMVDENVMRREMTLAEQAEAATAYAADPATPARTVHGAIDVLFAHHSHDYRRQVACFAELLNWTGGLLRYPSRLSPALGLALHRRLSRDAALRDRIAAALDGWDNRSIAEETAVLERIAGEETTSDTSLTVAYDGGEAAVNADDGRLEIRCDTDFARLPPEILSRVVRILLHGTAGAAAG